MKKLLVVLIVFIGFSDARKVIEKSVTESLDKDVIESKWTSAPPAEYYDIIDGWIREYEINVRYNKSTGQLSIIGYLENSNEPVKLIAYNNKFWMGTIDSINLNYSYKKKYFTDLEDNLLIDSIKIENAYQLSKIMCRNDMALPYIIGDHKYMCLTDEELNDYYAIDTTDIWWDYFNEKHIFIKKKDKCKKDYYFNIKERKCLKSFQCNENEYAINEEICEFLPDNAVRNKTIGYHCEDNLKYWNDDVCIPYATCLDNQRLDSLNNVCVGLLLYERWIDSSSTLTTCYDGYEYDYDPPTSCRKLANCNDNEYYFNKFECKELPTNAVRNGNYSYKCKDEYALDDNNFCRKLANCNDNEIKADPWTCVQIPEHSHIVSGDIIDCDDGYMQFNNSCIEIPICNNNEIVFGNSCIAIPEHAHKIGVNDWTCDDDWNIGLDGQCSIPNFRYGFEHDVLFGLSVFGNDEILPEGKIFFGIEFGFVYKIFKIGIESDIMVSVLDIKTEINDIDTTFTGVLGQLKFGIPIYFVSYENYGGFLEPYTQLYLFNYGFDDIDWYGRSFKMGFEFGAMLGQHKLAVGFENPVFYHENTSSKIGFTWTYVGIDKD